MHEKILCSFKHSIQGGAKTAVMDLATSWETKVAKKRALQKAAIQPYLDPTRGEISSLPTSITGIDDISVLVERIGFGELKAENVIRAYVER